MFLLSEWGVNEQAMTGASSAWAMTFVLIFGKVCIQENKLSDFVGFQPVPLSEMICQVFENIFSAGAQFATMQSLLFIMSINFINLLSSFPLDWVDPHSLESGVLPSNSSLLPSKSPQTECCSEERVGSLVLSAWGSFTCLLNMSAEAAVILLLASSASAGLWKPFWLNFGSNRVASAKKLKKRCCMSTANEFTIAETLVMNSQTFQLLLVDLQPPCS